jgi:hypothetical protein
MRKIFARRSNIILLAAIAVAVIAAIWCFAPGGAADGAGGGDQAAGRAVTLSDGQTALSGADTEAGAAVAAAAAGGGPSSDSGEDPYAQGNGTTAGGTGTGTGTNAAGSGTDALGSAASGSADTGSSGSAGSADKPSGASNPSQSGGSGSSNTSGGNSGGGNAAVSTPPAAPAAPKATLSIDCYTILNNMGTLTKGKEGLVGNGVIMSARTVSFTEGESVFDVLTRETRAGGIHMESAFTPMYNSAYIEGINNLYEFDCGALSGWMYSVNGWYPNYGCSQYFLKDGDVIAWRYTCDLGADVGGAGAAQG